MALMKTQESSMKICDRKREVYLTMYGFSKTGIIDALHPKLIRGVRRQWVSFTKRFDAKIWENIKIYN